MSTPTSSATTPTKPASRMVTFECRVCKFKMTRLATKVNDDCAKCQQPNPHTAPAKTKAAVQSAPSTKPTIQQTLAANKTPIIAERKPTPDAKKITFQCKSCHFNISRFEKDLGLDCPKCNTPKPYVSPEQAAKQAAIKQNSTASSTAAAVSTIPCPKRVGGGVHEYSLGSCRHCKVSQGTIEDKKTATHYPGAKTTGVAACEKNNGGKHTFFMAKCKQCGLSEMEYTKAMKAAPTTPMKATPRASTTAGATATPTRATSATTRPVGATTATPTRATTTTTATPRTSTATTAATPTKATAAPRTTATPTRASTTTAATTTRPAGATTATTPTRMSTRPAGATTATTATKPTTATTAKPTTATAAKPTTATSPKAPAPAATPKKAEQPQQPAPAPAPAQNNESTQEDNIEKEQIAASPE